MPDDTPRPCYPIPDPADPRLDTPEGGGTAAMRALATLVNDHGVERIARSLLTWEGNIEDMIDGSTEIRIDRAREIHTLAATLRL